MNDDILVPSRIEAARTKKTLQVRPCSLTYDARASDPPLIPVTEGAQTQERCCGWLVVGCWDEREGPCADTACVAPDPAAPQSESRSEACADARAAVGTLPTVMLPPPLTPPTSLGRLHTRQRTLSMINVSKMY